MLAYCIDYLKKVFKEQLQINRMLKLINYNWKLQHQVGGHPNPHSKSTQMSQKLIRLSKALRRWMLNCELKDPWGSWRLVCTVGLVAHAIPYLGTALQVTNSKLANIYIYIYLHLPYTFIYMCIFTTYIFRRYMFGRYTYMYIRDTNVHIYI